MTTIFAKIIEGSIPAEKVYEDDKILAIKDINPHAPVHLLIMPKAAYPNLQSLTEKDLPIMMDVVRVAQTLAKEFGIEEGYRLITNNGSSAGQTVFHLHFHLLGGKDMGNLG